MNQKPHSRDKRVGSGQTNVNKGNRVNTGSRPLGGGGRTSGIGSGNGGRKGTGNGINPQSSFGGNGGVQRGFGTPMAPRGSSGFSLKKILIIAVIVVAAVMILKTCGGGLSTGQLPGFESIFGDDYNNTDIGSTDYNNFSGASLDTTVSPLARAKRVTPVGGGDDTVTIMVYMCGTDLESKYGMATKDLTEMASAKISDKVNIIVETGGCKEWKNSVVSSKNNQIYRVVEGGLVLLEENFGNKAMTDPGNLTSFIDYCEKNYPASRNMLIFWDHGGGSVSGYGYDEKNPNSSSMTLSRIQKALDDADCTFDVIGFDACLMATFETALVSGEYADYLLASEETEPGTGWYYTRWITELSENTSIPTTELSKIVIDDFVTSSSKASRDAKVTLSLIDLAELEGAIPKSFTAFASSTNDMIRSDGYQQVSAARAGARQFAQSSKINQVDLVDLAQRIGTEDAQTLAKALRGCIKYNRSTISNCYGVSIYFPYENTKTVGSAIASYEALGVDDEYTKCIQSFASLGTAGQAAGAYSQQTQSSGGYGDLLGSILSNLGGGGASTSPVGALLGAFTGGGTASAGNALDISDIAGLLGAFSGRSMPEGMEWVDTELIADQAERIAGSFLDPARICITEKDGKRVLSLNDEEWSLVRTVELNVFVDDGEGFIDLGYDNTFAFDGNDLLLDYDGTWLTLNGNVCAYYLVSDTEQPDGSYTTIGRIPALLNGTLVNLQVVFDKNNPYGIVTGAYPAYENGETDVEAKGLIGIKSGDTIQLLCDYYDYDGNYSASYELGNAFIVPASGLTLENLTVNADDVSVTYRLTDTYGNRFWTPAFPG